MPFLKSPVLVLVGTQLLFTAGDLLARSQMRHKPLSVSTFLTGWFMIYFVSRQVATVGQLYVFSSLPIGKTMALFGAVSIVVVNILGFLLLGEVLSTPTYVAIALSILAFAMLALSR